MDAAVNTAAHTSASTPTATPAPTSTTAPAETATAVSTLAGHGFAHSNAGALRAFQTFQKARACQPGVSEARGSTGLWPQVNESAARKLQRLPRILEKVLPLPLPFPFRNPPARPARPAPTDALSHALVHPEGRQRAHANASPARPACNFHGAPFMRRDGPIEAEPIECIEYLVRGATRRRLKTGLPTTLTLYINGCVQATASRNCRTLPPLGQGTSAPDPTGRRFRIDQWYGRLGHGGCTAETKALGHAATHAPKCDRKRRQLQQLIAQKRIPPLYQCIVSLDLLLAQALGVNNFKNVQDF